MASFDIGYTIGPLQEYQIERAFVVARAAVPALTLTSWRHVTGGALRRSFVVATDAKGYVRGLCHARFVNHPIVERLLDVAIFVVVSPLQEQEIEALLIAFLKRKALDASCRYLRIWRARLQDWSLLDDEDYRDRWDHGTVYPL
ncbi:hypothetical protein [Rhizobium sp. BK376]|uniref:hypothetical protein n=1 Tax=Rhizobium sp. BK376 TaxID=2512149 RepID=UPI00104C1126|nr:hypothetical protein [Rhizobium sp. BK376]TCR76706.1 hypothetical protein EV561_12064 [Rhizobium sp. BK376]